MMPYVYKLPAALFTPITLQGMIGYTHRVVEGGWAPWQFFGETSSWSSTQTVIISGSSSTSPEVLPTPSSMILSSAFPSQSDSATSSQQGVSARLFFGFGWGEATLGLFVIVITVLLVVGVIYLNKRRAFRQISCFFATLTMLNDSGKADSSHGSPEQTHEEQ